MGEIHDAIRRNDIRSIDNILNRDGNIVEKEHGLTPLMVAIGEANDETLAHLIGHGARVDVKCNGMTPLILSSIHGYSGSATLLVQAGADPNIRDSKGFTPLMFAAQGGSPDVAKVLINAGADLGLKNKKDQTALDLATEAHQAVVAALLVESGAKVSDMMLYGANKSKLIGWLQNSAPLLAAAVLCDSNVMKIKLADPQANRHAHDEAGRDLLSIAAVNGCLDVIDLLVEEGFDVNARTVAGWSALDMAILACQAHSVRRLLERGANPLSKAAGKASPLMYAADDRKIPVLLELIRFARQHGIRLDIEDALKVARRDGQHDAVRTLTTPAVF